jgi:hypothetical protein
MKEFNLKDALAGNPVITRDGRPVRIAGYNPDVIESQRIAAWIGDFICDYGENGKRYSYTNYDLFMAPSERKEWVVIYTNTTGRRFSSLEFSYEMALHVKSKAIKNGYKNVSIHEITISE